MARSSYHHGDLKNALIAGGLAVLSREGAAALTLQKVARRAGVSTTAIYRHFESKEALLAAVGEQGFHMLSAEMDRVLAAPPRGHRRFFEEAVLAYVRFARTHPHHYHIMFGGGIENRHAYADFEAAGRESFGRLIATVRRLQDEGYFRKGRPLLTAFTVWSTLHGLVTLYREELGPETAQQEEPERVAALIARTLVQGLRAP